jgi:hypothetical protein
VIWIIKPIMRPIALRKLKRLYAEMDLLKQSINSRRKSKSKVSDIYALAKRVNMECLRWERWL